MKNTQRKITILPTDEMRIIKQIIIISDLNDNTNKQIGHILYERKLSSDYKFIETPKDKKDFSYYLEYPKQESFPNDNIDDVFLQSVRNLYPNSIVKNHSLISNVDIDKIESLKKQKIEESAFQITPDFITPNIFSLAGREFEQTYFKVNLYKNINTEEISNIVFYGYYNIDNNQIIEKINDIKFI